MMVVDLPGPAAESGGGPPQSKTWRLLYGSNRRGSVLECASPVALAMGWVSQFANLNCIYESLPFAK
jgi:hypothetical protein